MLYKHNSQSQFKHIVYFKIFYNELSIGIYLFQKCACVFALPYHMIVDLLDKEKITHIMK